MEKENYMEENTTKKAYYEDNYNPIEQANKMLGFLHNVEENKLEGENIIMGEMRANKQKKPEEPIGQRVPNFKVPTRLLEVHEQHTELTKEYMKNALNKIDKEREGWKKAIDTENLELYLKTENTLNIAVGKIVMYFDADKYTIKDILNIVLNPEVRLTWDDSVREMELIEKVDEYIDTYYMLLNIPFPFQNREFLQKRVKFEEDGTFYMYFSTIPSDTYYRFSTPEHPRGTTYMGGIKLQRIGNKIRYFVMSINDVKIKIIPQWIIKSFFPSKTKSLQKKMLAKLEELDFMKKMGYQMPKKKSKFGFFKLFTRK